MKLRKKETDIACCLDALLQEWCFVDKIALQAEAAAHAAPLIDGRHCCVAHGVRVRQQQLVERFI